MNDLYLQNISYTKFSKRIFERIKAERIPFSGTLELTFRCNHKCTHCYAANAPKGEELSYNEICDILDTIVNNGCLWLLITGGEPFIRNDFLKIYLYAKKKGLLITLFTNGTFITEEIADVFQKWPPFKVEITLHAISKKIYEKITRTNNSFENCMRGIRLLLQKKIYFGLKTVVMTHNKDEIEEIKKYVEKLGIEFRFDTLIHAGLGGNKSPCDVRITPEEVVDLDIKDKKRSNAWIEFCQKFWGPVNSGYLYNCGAGWNSFHIDPYGKLSVCGTSRIQNYDLRKGSFEDGYYNFFPKILTQKLKNANNRCDQCEMLDLCGHCPELAQLESGDPEKPIKYLCQIAHLRAAAFKKEVGRNEEKTIPKAFD